MLLVWRQETRWTGRKEPGIAVAAASIENMVAAKMNSSLRRQHFAPLLGFFLGITVYSPCLLSDFTWDDRAAEP